MHRTSVRGRGLAIFFAGLAAAGAMGAAHGALALTGPAQTNDVAGADPDGMTPLHWAAYEDDVDGALALLEAGADPDARNRYGVTPLSLAALNGNAVLIEGLLEAGADPNTVTREGETVLMIAARTGRPEAVRALLAAGADPDARETWQEQTALMWAAAENNAAAIESLAAAGAGLDLQSKVWAFPEYRYETNGMAVFQLPRGGWTALMYAARQNAKDAARALAAAGADLDAVDGDGSTALQLAVINIHYDMAALLVELGADPDVQDSSGMTALYAAVDMRAPAGMMTRPNPSLPNTARLDAAGLARVLLENGADPDRPLAKPIIGRHNNLVGDTSLGEGATPLARAARRNDVAMIRLLLEFGADPTVTLKDRTTPAMIATSLSAIELLVEHGVDVDAFNTDGASIVHAAAARGADDVIRYAAGRGARLDRPDRRGRTPLDMALGAGGGRGGGQVRETTAALLRELAAE